MNPDYDNRLEKAVDRELRDLPDLSAPDTLVPAVMARIRACSVLPWYRRSWPTWPTSLRFASLFLMLALFGGLCYGGWKISHAETLTLSMQSVGEWFSATTVIWRTVAVLGEAIFLFVKQLNAAFLVALIAVAVFSYAACIGLGTAFFRYARESHL